MATKVLRWGLVFLLAACTRNCGPRETGVRVRVEDAHGRPVLSRIVVFKGDLTQAYLRPVTEAWVRAEALGTTLPLSPGNYFVRAQGTGDTFLYAPVEVKHGRRVEVRLAFGSIELDGSRLELPGRVRVRSLAGARGKDGALEERVIVTRRVGIGEYASIEVAPGKYRLAFLPEGAPDEPAGWRFLGTVEVGSASRVTVRTEFAGQ